ncbi:MAG: hypothetical protein FJ247_14155, partial [Nitrospira sp.]|nr:hypothetical protein [Nitrospira sp.]
VVWPLADNQGTIRDLVDETGSVLNHIKYDSFGKVTSETNGAVDFLFGYTGRERDEETGLYYYRARFFDPLTGRFISEDPLGFAAGDANVDRYVGNHPNLSTDPMGLQEGIGIRQDSIVRDKERERKARESRESAWPTPPIPPTPETPPGPDWKWAGPDQPGGYDGHWKGPRGEELHPDLNHKPPKGPHWGLWLPGGNEYDYFPGPGKWVPNPDNKPNRPSLDPRLLVPVVPIILCPKLPPKQPAVRDQPHTPIIPGLLRHLFITPLIIIDPEWYKSEPDIHGNIIA